MVRLLTRTAAALAVAGGIVIAGLGIGSIHVGGTDPAAAQDRRQNQPGKFDFYVLSLSWSPSFCEATQERGRESKEQCGERPYSFVVHGLWPQYEKGFPEFCVVPAPRLDRNWAYNPACKMARP